MISKLLNCDPKEVTQSRAGAAWLAEVNRLVREQGLSLADAWKQLRETEPELLERISDKADTAAAALVNGDGTPQPPALSVLLSEKPFACGAFHLPVNVDNDILEAAWRGNGSQFVRVDAVKVFMAVQVYFMKVKGLTAIDARIEVCDKFPELALFAKQTPEQPAEAAGNFGTRLA